jgi:predicted membrane channel-forming protein YqfA (hemolysin III family)
VDLVHASQKRIAKYLPLSTIQKKEALLQIWIHLLFIVLVVIKYINLIQKIIMTESEVNVSSVKMYLNKYVLCTIVSVDGHHRVIRYTVPLVIRRKTFCGAEGLMTMNFTVENVIDLSR